jgi:hypothetical protein
MTDEQFYMQLCYILLNKFCDGRIEITASEWDAVAHKKGLALKHRYNKKNDTLEVMAFENDKVN